MKAIFPIITATARPCSSGGRLPLWNNRLELSAGAGPYRWFDTKQAQLGGDYSNTHGWGGLFSLRAAYYFDNRWIAEVKLNRVQAYGGRIRPRCFSVLAISSTHPMARVRARGRRRARRTSRATKSP